MLTQNYLSLRSVRLDPAAQWTGQGAGVCFVFPLAGAGQFASRMAEHVLAPGAVLVLDGDPSAKIIAGQNAALEFSYFSVRVEHLFPLFTGKEISLLQTIVDGFSGSKLYPAGLQLALDCHQLLSEISPEVNLHHRGQLLRLAAAVLNEEFQNAHGRRVGYISSEDHLAQVFDDLSPEELVTLSVPELAEKFGCSRRHLNRLFQQHFGVSIACLRMEMRLLKAASLLRDSGAKVINVAEQCGFNHLGLFNTCFRRRFGISPGQWRKQEHDLSNPAIQHSGKVMDSLLQITRRCFSPADTGTTQSPAAEKKARDRIRWRPPGNASAPILRKSRPGKRRL